MSGRLLLFAILLAASAAEARAASLEQWVEQDMIPGVTHELVTHPRFKGQTLMFVVLDDGAPAAISSVLAISLRDRLLDAALRTEGIRVAARQSGPAAMSAAKIDCARDDVDYYVGIELERRLDGRYEINVRALDLAEQSWVGGFGERFRGGLNRLELAAAREKRADATFAGSRDVPFTSAQTDLLARQLARRLSCSLLRQASGDYVVAAAADVPTDDALALIRNNVLANDAIETSPDANRVNAELTARAHSVDGALHEYWLTITPIGEDTDLKTLSASAYVVLPAAADAVAAAIESNGSKQVVPPRHAVATISMPNAGADGLLGPLGVVTRGREHCRPGHEFLRTRSFWAEDGRCSLLEASARSDAVVFYLEHQPQLGLVRLAGHDCRDRTTARIARRGDVVRFPIAWFRDEEGSVREIDEWRLSPAADTYYAIAVSDARLGRQLANLIDALPVRCGAASRPGLRGRQLADWLERLASIAARTPDAFDWRALQLKDVY